ncbi:MAG: LemA family protein [Bacteroidetes bacterium]|nr:LemA family protein [Bacteroidota bacterium]
MKRYTHRGYKMAESKCTGKDTTEQEVAQQGLDKAMVNVLALTEQYPDLKSDAGFRVSFKRS